MVESRLSAAELLERNKKKPDRSIGIVSRTHESAFHTPFSSQENSTPDWLQVHCDFDGVRAPTKNQAPERAYIAVIPPPGQRYVAVGGGDIVCRIYIEPADSPTKHGNPGMRRIGAHQPWLARRWIGSKVATYITGREVDRSQAGDLHVRKVLAHAAPLLEDFFNRCPGRCHFRIEAKVIVDA
jgi:hypothetical protein